MKLSVNKPVLIQTPSGIAEVISFDGFDDGKEHVIFAYGNWRQDPAPQIRIHSECLTGDVFSSERCDCGPQLAEAVKRFAESSGLIIYLRQEGRGIGLNNKLKAYQLQDLGHDTYEANRLLGFHDDQRDYQVAAEMLKALGVERVRVLSNNPRKALSLKANGIDVGSSMSTHTYLCSHNARYLEAKVRVGGHQGLRILSEGVDV